MKKLLPYKSKSVLFKFYCSSANEPFSIWRTVMANTWECFMDFMTMSKRLDENTKACRSAWAHGEFLWKKDNILVHNTPYLGAEEKSEKLGAYVYVCEKNDMEANDWMIVSCEEE